VFAGNALKRPQQSLVNVLWTHVQNGRCGFPVGFRPGL